MLILSNEQLCVGIYGLGLIGSSIGLSLRNLSAWHKQFVRIEWGDPTATIENSIEALATTAESSARSAIVWSAGVCGFGASEAETSGELETFAHLLSTSERAGRLTASDLHVVSSAGGPFEGQICINQDDIPKSFRPYSSLKLAQEARAEKLVEPYRLHVYRPSSVYGRVRAGHRLGLVSTLVKNAFECRVTHLVGRTHSLRDYVWADDIGDYIARRIYLATPSTQVPHVLAHGKPSSVFEIQRTVESVMGRRTYISFDVKGDNDRHTTFGPSALPKYWYPHTIAYGVRAIVEDFRSYRRAA